MLSYLQYPNFTSFNLVEYTVSRGVEAFSNPVFSFLAFGKIAENPVATPSSSVQTIKPTAFNRYIQSVTVNPVSTTALTVTPSTSVQTFTEGFYNPVTVEATS